MQVVVGPEVQVREELGGGELAKGNDLRNPLPGEQQFWVFDPGETEGGAQIDRVLAGLEDRPHRWPWVASFHKGLLLGAWSHFRRRGVGWRLCRQDWREANPNEANPNEANPSEANPSEAGHDANSDAAPTVHSYPLTWNDARSRQPPLRYDNGANRCGNTSG